MAKYTSLRFLLALRVLRQYNMIQLDVKNDFLNGSFNEEIYLEVPHGINLDVKDVNCFRLRKALYGSKQATRAWNDFFESCIIKFWWESCVPFAIC